VDLCSVTCLRFEAETPDSVFIKHHMNGLFYGINASRRGRRVIKATTFQSNMCSNLQLNHKKIKDIEGLLPHILAVYHPH
jgi:hypothetical protein